ncbi:MAG TPA: CDP-alcohol phosphatidyltransferase family protein [Actinomycetota bacterium]|nr:CDP-alcohol phosphatidyltransferase family protein [Actinomycetota bacterium]
MAEDDEAREPPRVRDMPAPRRNESAIGPVMQRLFAWPFRLLLAGLYRAGVRPWQLTLASFAANLVAGGMLLAGDRFVPAVVLVVAGMLDVLDGSLARLRGEERRSGAFLDSVLDRVSDTVLFACLSWSLSGQGQRTEAALALVTLVVSLLVSHVRAEAEAAGVRVSEGLFQRLERYVVLILGLAIPGALLPALALLAALGAVTLGQRVWSAGRRLAAR